MAKKKNNPNIVNPTIVIFPNNQGGFTANTKLNPLDTAKVLIDLATAFLKQVKMEEPKIIVPKPNIKGIIH